MQTTARRPKPRKNAAASTPPHEPRRTCVGCRAVRAQRELVRVAADGRGGVAVTLRRVSGRGVYLCPSADCLEAALRRRVLPRALRAELPGLDTTALRQQLSAGADRAAATGARSRRS
jgi:predicted RNA-binding protein YlxR (DUF448 family)